MTEHEQSDGKPLNRPQSKTMTSDQTCLTASLTQEILREIHELQTERHKRVQNVCDPCRGKNTNECRELYALPQRQNKHFNSLLADDKNKVGNSWRKYSNNTTPKT